MESTFTAEYRSQLRAGLLERAKADTRITGVAVTGSASVGMEDRWSDIDLAFGVAAEVAVPSVLEDWTALMYARHHAVHHMDLLSGAWTYRVFFLPNTLQVDLAFVSESEFRGLGPTFQLVHGKANESRPLHPVVVESPISWGWLYALHARSCIARGKWWQAEYMISGVRDQALSSDRSRRLSWPGHFAPQSDNCYPKLNWPTPPCLRDCKPQCELCWIIQFRSGPRRAPEARHNLAPGVSPG